MTKTSTAAEYVALSELVSEIKVVKNLLKDFKVRIEKPIKIFEDNSGAKYIEVYHHFGNESYKQGIIQILKVDIESNLADILTKALGRVV